MSELLRRMLQADRLGRRVADTKSYDYDFTERAVKDAEWLSTILQRLDAEVKRLRRRKVK